MEKYWSIRGSGWSMLLGPSVSGDCCFWKSGSYSPQGLEIEGLSLLMITFQMKHNQVLEKDISRL